MGVCGGGGVTYHLYNTSYEINSAASTGLTIIREGCKC